MKTLSFKVSDALDNRIEVAVKQRGARKSVLVREALERFLSESREAQGGSVLDVAGKLAGCVRNAPRDLSSNPRHLRGFGK